jgi:hypothetical protein
VVAIARCPSVSSRCTVTPGVFVSIRKQLMPRCLGAWGSVRVAISTTSPAPMPEVNIFWPRRTKASPSRLAVVRSAAASEPDSGSDRANATDSSPRAAGGAIVACCSGVP